jgi:hypothetical protein
MGTTSKMDVGQEFVNRTMALGKPIVYVSANYRLNGEQLLLVVRVDPE